MWLVHIRAYGYGKENEALQGSYRKGKSGKTQRRNPLQIPRVK